MDENQETVNFSDVLSALKDIDTPFPPRLLRSFSDLTHRNVKDILQIWSTLPESRKIGILEDLDDLIEKDTLVNFDELAKAVIIDPSANVRVTALGLLWECEEARTVPLLLDLLHNDPDEAVRATSASLLGRFVLLGELDSISDKLRDEIVEHLIDISQSTEMPRVKQRALESLGYSCHPMVEDLIRLAYETHDVPWIASALCAMGRSADDQWEPLVLACIKSEDTEVQFEAVRSAGELELASAREPLLQLLDENNEDDETRLAILWSLSQIGGDEVKEKFDELLSNATDDEEIEWIEKAMENLELSLSPSLDMLDFSSNALDEDLDFDEATEEFEEYADEDDDEEDIYGQ